MEQRVVSKTQKQDILASLDAEIDSRSSQLKSYYEFLIASIKLRGEMRVGKMPQHLRNVQMSEMLLSGKYNGQTKEWVLGTRMLKGSNTDRLVSDAQGANYDIETDSVLKVNSANKRNGIAGSPVRKAFTKAMAHLPRSQKLGHDSKQNPLTVTDERVISGRISKKA